MYLQFSQERDNTRRVTQADLEQQNFRCGHCGLAFCDEELAKKGIESPHGERRKPKNDPLKPHWSRADYRVPTLDHRWPISLYGSNDLDNLLVLCKGCNVGKANRIAREQLEPFIGLPQRDTLLARYPLSPDLFYAQLIREPACSQTKQTAIECELTVEIVDPTKPAFLDNLTTVMSPGI